MAIVNQLLTRLALSAAILGGAAALPAHADPVTPAVTDPSAPSPFLHDINSIAEKAVTEALRGSRNTPPPAGVPAPSDLPVAADTQGGDTAVATGPTTAAEAARDSAAEVGVCNAYFTQSQALAPLLVPALKAMGTHDMATLATLLPGLEAQLDQLPASEIRPEVCDGTHINAYTRHQYIELSVLRAHNIDTGFPANLTLVKQPELNQNALAFVVGWIKFEQKDYNGALAAFGHGLAMFPHDHNLQNEYAASLISLKEGALEVAFIDSVLNGTYDLDDKERANLFAGRAIGLAMLHALDASDQSFTISLRYNYVPQVKAMQDQLRAIRAGAATVPAPATPAPATPAPASK